MCSQFDHCPHCNANLIGDAISAEVCKQSGHPPRTHWRREISLYSRELDRTIAWKCPDCHQEWPQSSSTVEEAAVFAVINPQPLHFENQPCANS